MEYYYYIQFTSYFDIVGNILIILIPDFSQRGDTAISTLLSNMVKIIF